MSDDYDLSGLFAGIDYTNTNPDADVDTSNDEPTNTLEIGAVFTYQYDSETRTGRVVEIDGTKQLITVVRLKDNGEDMPAYRDIVPFKDIRQLEPDRYSEYDRKVGMEPELGAENPNGDRPLTNDEHNARLGLTEGPRTGIKVEAKASDYKIGHYASYSLHDGTQHVGKIADNDKQNGVLTMEKLIGDNLEHNETVHKIAYHAVRNTTDDVDKAKKLESSTRVDSATAKWCRAVGVALPYADERSDDGAISQAIASLLPTKNVASDGKKVERGDLVQYTTADNVMRFGRVYSVGVLPNALEIKRSKASDSGNEILTNQVDRIPYSAAKVIEEFPNAIQALACLLKQYK